MYIILGAFWSIDKFFHFLFLFKCIIIMSQLKNENKMQLFVYYFL
jgi:hypothetical protein